MDVCSDQELSTDAETDSDGPTLMDNIRYSKDAEGNRIYNGVVITKSGWTLAALSLGSVRFFR